MRRFMAMKIVKNSCLTSNPNLPPKMLANPQLKKITVDSMVINRELAFETWQVHPDLQREVIDNKKLEEVVAELLVVGAYPEGVIIIGCLNGVLYKVDGNYRMRAFEKTNLPSIRASVQFIRFESLEEMTESYRRLQGQIKKSTPNDRLKVLANVWPPIRHIAEECRFVTYIKATKSAGRLVTMATVIQIWAWSKTDPPKPKTGGSLEDLAKGVTQEDAAKVVEFLKVCRSNFGADFPPMWKANHLSLCLWLYRRMVWREDAENQRWAKLTSREFGSGTAVLRNADYVKLITGKNLSRDEDRNILWQEFIREFRKGLAANVGKSDVKVPHIAGYTTKRGK